MATKKSGSPKSESPSKLIDARIQELGDWRGKMLSQLRALVKQADPEVVEEWKWEVPVWSHDGLICTGESYKSVVKLTFAKGADLEDPAGLFNSSLGGNTSRAIDFREGEKIDEKAFKALIRAAVMLNMSASKSRSLDAGALHPRGRNASSAAPEAGRGAAAIGGGGGWAGPFSSRAIDVNARWIRGFGRCPRDHEAGSESGSSRRTGFASRIS
jgi:hypothetical protein